mmetsp:Transcript_70552/g.181889  ORF Transcript_70552/g.181889 Transcript_70552/m.181889 type:complete len:692 (-) Transcript_70552:589-2664(-)
MAARSAATWSRLGRRQEVSTEARGSRPPAQRAVAPGGDGADEAAHRNEPQDRDRVDSCAVLMPEPPLGRLRGVAQRGAPLGIRDGLEAPRHVADRRPGGQLVALEQVQQHVELRRAEAADGVPAARGVEAVVAAGSLAAAVVAHDDVVEGLGVQAAKPIQQRIEEAEGWSALLQPRLVPVRHHRRENGRRGRGPGLSHHAVAHPDEVVGRQRRDVGVGAAFDVARPGAVLGRHGDVRLLQVALHSLLLVPRLLEDVREAAAGRDAATQARGAHHLAGLLAVDDHVVGVVGADRAGHDGQLRAADRGDPRRRRRELRPAAVAELRADLRHLVAAGAVVARGDEHADASHSELHELRVHAPLEPGRHGQLVVAIGHGVHERDDVVGRVRELHEPVQEGLLLRLDLRARHAPEPGRHVGRQRHDVLQVQLRLAAQDRACNGQVAAEEHRVGAAGRLPGHHAHELEERLQVLGVVVLPEELHHGDGVARVRDGLVQRHAVGLREQRRHRVGVRPDRRQLGDRAEGRDGAVAEVGADPRRGLGEVLDGRERDVELDALDVLVVEVELVVLAEVRQRALAGPLAEDAHSRGQQNGLLHLRFLHHQDLEGDDLVARGHIEGLLARHRACADALVDGAVVGLAVLAEGHEAQREELVAGDGERVEARRDPALQRVDELPRLLLCRPGRHEDGRVERDAI